MTTPRYMLDTNIVSDLIRNPAGKAAKKLRKVGTDGLCVSIITSAELRFGAQKRGSSRLTDLVDQILGEIDILPLDLPADAEYARIRNDLERKGTPIGPNDLLIAAHACAVGATLVTGNAAEFKRVRGLKVENWLST
jgi:tRNA(fMet)-specific endonuclease VapC